MSANRLATIESTLRKPVPSPNDAVIVSAVRTPICKGNRGAFKDTHPMLLLAAVLRSCVERVKLDPARVEDITVGNVKLSGAGAGLARAASLMAGFPNTTSLHAVNRQCSSGLQAIATASAAIQNGYYDIGIAAGFESMSWDQQMGPQPDSIPESMMKHPEARNCVIPMGETSERVAERFGVSRQDQDALALASYQKALEAQQKNMFQEEIIPVTVQVVGPNGESKTVTVTKDEGPRPTTAEGLAKLRPAFRKDGSSTAGNSSQVSDGAAAVLLMKRSVAEALGLKPLGRLISFAVAGVPPDVMGIGPAYAIPPALKQANLRIEDIDVFEINEAFASQCLYCVRKLNIPMNKLNPLGGAIALGHPLGCTGTRMTATLLYEMRRRKSKYGIVSMCIGTGMGACGVFEAE